MIGRMLNLKQAAEHVHMDPNELRHVAQRGEVEAVERGSDWMFDHRTLDEWAQRNLLSVGNRELKRQHRVMMDEHRRERRTGWGVAGLLNKEAIELSLTAKAKAGILRDMTELAGRTGMVYDTDALYKELVAREEAASTAMARALRFCIRAFTTLIFSRIHSLPMGVANGQYSSARPTGKGRGTSF